MKNNYRSTKSVFHCWQSFLILVLFLCGLAPKAFAQTTDLVVYDESLASGWLNYSWITSNVANTTPVHAGTKSISAVDSSSPAQYQALYFHHSAFPSTPYSSLSFWYYPTVAGTNQVQVMGTLNGAAQTAVHLSFTAGQVNTWVHETVTLASLGVADNRNFDGFWIQNTSGGNLTFYVDDISLVYAPPPSPVNVSINAASVLRTIDDRVYGINMSVWDANVSNAATAGIMSGMNIKVMRLPGGSASDDYDWQIGKQHSNQSFMWSTHVDTFARVVEAQGAQAFVTVNYGSGTPEQAAAWVAYYNGSTTDSTSLGTDSLGRNWQTVGYWASLRAAAPLGTDDGKNFLRMTHPAPFGFKYWEVGNENYGSWEYDQHGVSGSGLTGVAHDPYTYANSYPTFFTKMKAVDSTIKIGIPIVPGEDNYGNGTHGVANPNESGSIHTGWTPVVLATLKSLSVQPDFLSHHFYTQNPGAETDAFLLQSSAGLATDATNIRKMITDFYGTGGAAIELNVTECNSVVNSPGKQTVSLVDALYMADTLGWFGRTEFNACTWWSFHDGGFTTGNNSSSLYGWRTTYGDYGVVADGTVSGVPLNTKFPTYYAERLMTHWGRGGDSVVSTTSSYGDIGAHTAKLANGSLAILLINKHPTDNINVAVAISGFTVGSTTATVYSYGKTNDTAQTDLTTGTATVGSTFTATVPSYSMEIIVISPPGSTTDSIGNGSFETPALAANAYSVTPSGATWAFAGSSGIQHNGSPWGAPTAPDGTQTAFMQVRTGVTNGSLSQTVNITSAGTYNLSFLAASRGGYPVISFNVLVDGTVVGTYSPSTTTSFTPITTPTFSLTTGNHTIGFAALGSVADAGIFLDAVGVGKILTVGNAGFETPAYASGGWAYTPTGASWTFTGYSGIQNNGSPWGAATAPEGVQAAMLQVRGGTGSGSIAQTVNFDTTGAYVVGLKASLRGGGYSSAISFNVLVDGTVVGTFAPTSTTTFTDYATVPFTVSTAGNHTVTLTALGTSADSTDFVDAITVAHHK